jgi:hypothetical protein
MQRSMSCRKKKRSSNAQPAPASGQDQPPPKNATKKRAAPRKSMQPKAPTTPALPPSPPAPQSYEPPPGERTAPTPSQPLERQAELVKRGIIPACLVSALGMDQYVGASGYRMYLDHLRRDAGNPSDPIEIMLLEQLAICHLRAAQLQGRAGEAAGMEAIELYNILAARLSAEFRKTALTLQTYRDRRPTA